MKDQAVHAARSSAATASLRQTGMLLAIVVLWAGLHAMKWAGKPL